MGVLTGLLLEKPGITLRAVEIDEREFQSNAWKRDLGEGVSHPW